MTYIAAIFNSLRLWVRFARGLLSTSDRHEGRGLVAALCCVSAGLTACSAHSPKSIAVIPRTTGTILWEPENVGAEAAASELGERIYWNASSREDDVDGQIALVDQVAKGGYRGLVLAPDHALALITPVRRALASGVPIVVVGSPLQIPPSSNLAYVLNDELEGSRLAGERVAALMHGRGAIGLTGIDPDIAGIMLRASNLETYLARQYPDIHISVRRMGTFNFAHEQEGAEEMLREHPAVKVIVALTSSSMRGAVSAIESQSKNRGVKVIGFDPDSLPFESGSLDSLISQNIRAMGECAVRLIHDRAEGKPFPARVVFKPVLVTRDNVTSRAVEDMLLVRWQPETAHLQRSEAP